MKHFSGNSSLIQVTMNSFIKTLFWNIYLCLLVLFFSWTNILLTGYTKQVPPCKVPRWNIWKKKIILFFSSNFLKTQSSMQILVSPFLLLSYTGRCYFERCLIHQFTINWYHSCFLECVYVSPHCHFLDNYIYFNQSIVSYWKLRLEFKLYR